ncbi:MAG: formate dehydrogenase accessory protein FdhE [bacterium]
MKDYISEDEIGCFKELNILKIKYKERLSLPIPDSLPIDFEKIEVDKGLLNEMFNEIVLCIEKYSKKAMEKRVVGMRELIENAKNGDFISINVLKPIFEKIGENFKDKIPSNWNKPYCPICGCFPLMAYLRRDDGKKVFECMLCKTQWEFLRIKCPYCGSEEKLRFFEIDEEGFRVDVCDKCMSYIKTIDKRKMDIQDIELEDIKTRYLDILAIKEGYKQLQNVE